MAACKMFGDILLATDKGNVLMAPAMLSFIKLLRQKENARSGIKGVFGH